MKLKFKVYECGDCHKRDGEIRSFGCAKNRYAARGGTEFSLVLRRQ